MAEPSNPAKAQSAPPSDASSATSSNLAIAAAAGAEGPAIAASRARHVDWLASEVERIETLLRPAPADVVKESIRLVTEPFAKSAGGEDDRVKAYALALEGFSPHAIAVATRRVLRGEDGDLDPRRFPPRSPPLLAELCRQAELSMRDDLTHRRRELEREKNPPAPEPTAEQQARIAEGLAGLSRDLGAIATERSLAEAAARSIAQAADLADGQAREKRVAEGLAARQEARSGGEAGATGTRESAP